MSVKHISYYVKLLKIKVKMKKENYLWISDIKHYVLIPVSEVNRLLSVNLIVLENSSGSLNFYDVLKN